MNEMVNMKYTSLRLGFRCGSKFIPPCVIITHTTTSRKFSQLVTMAAAVTPNDVLDFWMKDSKLWYKKDPNFDNEIKSKFEPSLLKAVNGELNSWLDTKDGAVALVIICDQFTRNMYRNTAKSFSYDPNALAFSKEAIKRGHDKALQDAGEMNKLSFLYMPFMHSESKTDHEEALKLFSKPGLEGNLKYEIMHKEIIDKFGRYCHRNEILGRKSTPEEVEFMKTHTGF